MSRRDVNPYEVPKTKKTTILRIFKLECKHQKEFELGEYKAQFNWGGCKECVCGFIPFIVGENVLRDVCFAIWHNEIIRKGK